MVNSSALSSSGLRARSDHPEPIPPVILARPQVSLKTTYLLFYNTLSCACWSTIFLRTILQLLHVGANRHRPSSYSFSDFSFSSSSSSSSPSVLNKDRSSFPSHLYDVVGPLLEPTQSLAILEIVHALTGVVRAGVVTTALQVASRMLLVWGIVEQFTPVRREWALVSMLLAWSVTEVVRYTYFVMLIVAERQKETASAREGEEEDEVEELEESRLEMLMERFVVSTRAALVWLRYNLFFELYPVGILSECWLVYKSIPLANKKNDWMGPTLWAILAIYIPGSYVLYTHMMAQRRRVMRGKKRAD